MIQRPDANWLREWRKRMRLGHFQIVVILIGLPLLFLFFRPTPATLAFCLVLSAIGAWSGLREARSGRLDVILPASEERPPSFARLIPILTLIGAVISALLNQAWIGALAYILFFWAGVLVGIVVANLTARV